MKIVHLNNVCYGSTGNISLGICEYANKKQYQSILYVPNTITNKKLKKNNVRLFGVQLLKKISDKVELLTGLQGHFHIINTFLLIGALKKENPDIVHLHNLHDGFANLRLFFHFLKRLNIPVVWTFHDSWPFTGRCPYLLDCDNWITGCSNCNYNKSSYPASKVHREKALWNLKRKLFTSIDNLTICCPSNWLAAQVKKSFFFNKNIITIENGIDFSLFAKKQTNFKQIHHIIDKYMVLCVAFSWNYMKGSDYVIALSKILPSNYVIVLVGFWPRCNGALPSNIISIENTENVCELASIYSAADVLFNPTRAEVFGLVNVESLACGTPVVTFNSGGSPDCIDEKTGFVVKQNNIQDALYKIKLICEYDAINSNYCIERAKKFSINRMKDSYITLYEKRTGK